MTEKTLTYDQFCDWLLKSATAELGYPAGALAPVPFPYAETLDKVRAQRISLEQAEQNFWQAVRDYYEDQV